MANGSSTPSWRAHTRRSTAWIVASGVIDWLLIVGTAVGGFYLGDIKPNKRPFQLENPDISFPYTLHETVTSRNLVIATVLVPVVVITIVSLVSIPGLTVPPGTLRSSVWRRKLWELYASLLSYALGMAAQWFIINGLKNICGKPRPDMLARCQPDLESLSRYVVGGIANITSNGQLVSADICTNTDASVLDDGFRSYPSGHSSSSAAGLGYLALFLAFKIGVVFPYAPPAISTTAAATSVSAFPSRIHASASQSEAFELDSMPRLSHGHDGLLYASRRKEGPDAEQHIRFRPAQSPISMRRKGAAPPLYLLVIVLAPFCGSVFIAASRWFDFRHHGFDILFGYFIGATTMIIAFRMYQLPLSLGAGWAWGPRSADKAFWAGVGSISWALPWEAPSHPRDEEEAYTAAMPHSSGTPDPTAITQRPGALRRMVGDEITYVEAGGNA